MDEKLMTLLEQRVRKECRNIKLTETAWGLDNDPTPLVQSKVLGAPFFPAAYADDYPRGDRGIPFVMLAQINFAEVPPMENFPRSGLLQLYVNPFDWSSGGYEVLFFDDEELKEPPLDVYDEILRGWLEDADYYLPVQRVHTMSFEPAYSYSGQDDRFYEHQLSLIAGDFSPEAAEQYATAHNTQYDSRIGGYSDFAQYDPRGATPCLQLLQLDSTDGINFYDCGILHLFIDEESASMERWENAIMYVDWY